MLNEERDLFSKDTTRKIHSGSVLGTDLRMRTIVSSIGVSSLPYA